MNYFDILCSMTPERKVKTKLCKLLKDEGFYFFFPSTGGYGRSGVADIVGCARGRFFSIECKADGKKLTPLQERELEAVACAGGISLTCIGEEGIPQVISILRRLSCERT